MEDRLKQVTRIIVAGGLICGMSAFGSLSASKVNHKKKVLVAKRHQVDPKYKAAVDAIKNARSLLRDYIASKPTGEEAYYAPFQLKALDNILPTDLPVAPVDCEDYIQWRILKITPKDSYTVVEFEMLNNSGLKRNFHWFVQNPLVLVANGKVYQMRADSIQLPKGAEIDGNHYVYLQDGQNMKVTVYFDPLDSGITIGYVSYYSGNPRVSFSLLNKNQNGPGN